ncbi:hypothetical protein C5E04_18840 [Pectobacterium parmentieri]|nr:hypothetical protein C5E04_18840 [Pectobacterium parmentieri]
MKNRYRVVADRYAGFEAQVKPWWFPFWWFQINGCNTNPSIHAARKVIEMHKSQRVYYYEE